MSRSSQWSLALLIFLTSAFSIEAFSDAKVLRLSAVNTPEPSGLLGDLIPIFERESGLKVVISSSNDPYGEANKCNADLVISHYGHKGIEDFIDSGGGKFPRPVFANQAALIGPRSDPAGIAGIADAVEAVKKIAASGAPFIVNHSPTERYLGDVLIASAGVTPKLIEVPDLKSHEAVAHAAKSGGYVLFGIIPFEIMRKGDPNLDLAALNYTDPLFQRVMVTVVVKVKACSGLNTAAAEALQKYLLEPRTQARVRAFRMPGISSQIWWPSGRNNSGPFLKSLGLWPN